MAVWFCTKFAKGVGSARQLWNFGPTPSALRGAGVYYASAMVQCDSTAGWWNATAGRARC
jgi:transcription initiation factor TFIIIB Brf1 subunit/transcription initiation factor TFIIB